MSNTRPAENVTMASESMLEVFRRYAKNTRKDVIMKARILEKSPKRDSFK